MSAERDVNRIVRSWIRAEEHESADRVLQTVLSRLDTTPQRRSFWRARRSTQMSRFAPFGLAAAAILAAVVVGWQLLPSYQSGSGGQATPSPTAGPNPTPSSSILPLLPYDALLPGTYRLVSFTNQPLTLTVPAGWTHADNFITKGDAWDGNGVTLATWQVSHIYSDSCDWEGTLIPVDSAPAIVAALADQQGHDTSEPSEMTLGGQPATRFELFLDSSFDVDACDRSIVRLWPDAGPKEQYGLPIYPGQTNMVHVVDHGDSVTLVVSIRNDDSVAADVSEMNAILASIEFLP
ncbi:MAG TPA: hypothetical protein VMQ65_11180 [Candidatus Limnocylindria bacterium]|nr:hypothetical protein [Candidatus Limnocylindria bacterium]